MPTTPGDYEFRLLLNNGYVIATASPPVAIANNPPLSSTPSTSGYDPNGNRVTMAGSTYTTSSTSNRLLSVVGTLSRTYTYDAAGNVTNDGTRTFTYDDSGRMSSVSGIGSATYIYNALGQRVRKVSGGATLYFVYDEAGHLLGEYDGSGALVQETIWLGDIPVATLRPNGSGGVAVYYVHTDHLNTPRRVSRPSDNAIVWRWDSDAFGTTAANSDPDGDSAAFTYNLRFPGQYFDTESGLHYNYMRDYDPHTGRYLQSDPIGLEGGINTYAYAGGNPVSVYDPLGMKQICLPGMRCYGEQDNPNLPGTPEKRPKSRIKPPKDLCAKSSTNAEGCLACCARGALRYGVQWQGQCNAECAWYHMACRNPDAPPANPALPPTAVPELL